MIQMHDRQNDTELRLQLEEKKEQRNGIRPARNGNPDAVSRSKKRPAGDSPLDRSEDVRSQM